MVVTSLIGAIVNIVSKYCLFISQSFEYTVYFIVMVYCVAFGCNSNSVVVKTFPFSDAVFIYQLAPMTSRP